MIHGSLPPLDSPGQSRDPTLRLCILENRMVAPRLYEGKDQSVSPEHSQVRFPESTQVAF